MKAETTSQKITGTGGQLLVDALYRHGTRQVYCVPGESYLAALDAFVDQPQINLVVCRQESGAAMMAGTTGRLTGKPGICFVTRGPGATNASSGVHIAWQDGQPMILLIGQVARHEAETDAFQEVDFRQMFGPMAKWIGQIEDAARVPEYLSRAFHIATSGRPGPVVLALPEDMLTDVVEADTVPPYVRTEASVSDADIDAMMCYLAQAQRPLAIVGGVGWDQASCERFEAFARACQIPVGTAFRCQDHFDNCHPNYLGDCGTTVSPALRKRIEDADLLLVAGVRVAHLTSPFKSLIGVPNTHQKFIHIHPGAEELGALTRPDLAINASMTRLTVALEQRKGEPMPERKGWVEDGNRDYLDWIAPVQSPGDVQMAQIMRWLSNRVSDDTIFTVGAGNYTMWVHRFVQSRKFGGVLGPMSGSMGFSTPAAIAAKVVHPDRMVISVVGDGCFMMTSQELATAVQHNLAIVWIVVNNSMFGTIRMHQERDYPQRLSATALTNPDFAALAQAHGAFGAVVTSTDQFEPAFEQACACGHAALIEVRIDPDAISTVTTLSEIRKAALAR